MKNSKKIIMSILALQTISFLILAYLGHYQYSTILETNIKNKQEKTSKEIEIIFGELKEKYITLANNIFLDKKVLSAFAHEDKEKLLDLTSPILNEFKRHNEFVNIMQFHTKDNHSFLRVHQPMQNGDDLKEIRKMVVNTNKNHTISYGLELGKYGVAYRVILPIFSEDEYIGSFELGIDIRYLLARLSKSNESIPSLIAKKSDLIDIIGEKNNIDDYTTPFSYGFIEFKFDTDQIQSNLNKGLINPEILKKDSYIKEFNNHKYLIFKSNILKDYNGHNVGFFVFKHDMSYYLDKALLIRYISIFITTTMIIIIGFLIYKLINDYAKKLNEKNTTLDYQAHHDALTAIPNRMYFIEKLNLLIDKSKQNNTKFALMFVDLDRFKQINDSLGHNVGDEVLKIVTKGLKNILRDSDFVARLGGDEFAILIENVKSTKDTDIIASKIIKTSSEPINIDGNILYSTCSIGICIYPDDGSDARELLKNADIAMYKSKDDGRHSYNHYTQEMTNESNNTTSIEFKMREAIKNSEFEPYFQPQIDTTNNKVVGLEALARWNSPTEGIIYPDKFIHIAEETGLIVDIEEQIYEKSMLIFNDFIKNDLEVGSLSLNLSVKYLNKVDFTSRVYGIIKKTGFNPDLLVLEITESAIMRDAKKSIEKLKTLFALGIELAIDDFGTGYSSLSYLKQLPINKLKIDKSFIGEIVNDTDDANITQAIISLAKNFKLSIIAEGVEDEAQRDLLLEFGCHLVQGYYFSKPLSAKNMQEYLQNRIIK